MIYRITTSTIPMRAEASDRSEMVNQLLYGEYVTHVRSSGSWMYARSVFGDYEGWLAMEYEPFQIEQETLIMLEQEATLDDGERGKVKLSPGSLLTKEELGRIESISSNSDSDNRIIADAQMFLGTPYLWGGRSLWGIDCSGLIQVVFSLSGIEVPRDAYQQAEHGEWIEFEYRRPGDVAFFENSKGRITHVGIIMGQGRIIHASGRVRIDGLDEQGILRNSDGKRTHELTTIKRFS